MIVTVLFLIVTVAVIVKMTKDTVKEMCEDYDCSRVDFERLIFDLDESGMPEFVVEIRLLSGRYDLAENECYDDGALDNEEDRRIDERRRAC